MATHFKNTCFSGLLCCPKKSRASCCSTT